MSMYRMWGWATRLGGVAAKLSLTRLGGWAGGKIWVSQKPKSFELQTVRSHSIFGVVSDIASPF